MNKQQTDGTKKPTPQKAQPDPSRRRMLLLLGRGSGLVGVAAFGYIVERLLTQNAASLVATSTTTKKAVATPAPTATTNTNTKATPTVGSTSAPTPTATVGHTGTVIAKTTDLAVNSALTFTLPSGGANPGVLIHLSNGKYSAFDTSCTHNPSCAVAYDSSVKLLVCPCHGAEFDPASNAAVLQGPAPTPLTPVQFKVNSDGTITVS